MIRVWHACIYCGVGDGRCYRERGGFWCHVECFHDASIARSKAEYAALCAGLDAVTVAWEQQWAERDEIVYDEVFAAETDRNAAIARAEAAKAQLRTARESLNTVNRQATYWHERADTAEAQATAHYEAFQDALGSINNLAEQIETAREDGARSMAAVLLCHPYIGSLTLDAAYEAWRAAQDTEATK